MGFKPRRGCSRCKHGFPPNTLGKAAGDSPLPPGEGPGVRENVSGRGVRRGVRTIADLGRRAL